MFDWLFNRNKSPSTVAPRDGGMTGNARASVHAQAGAKARAQIASQGNQKSGAGPNWAAGNASRNRNR